MTPSEPTRDTSPLQGEHVTLRPLHPDDIPILHAELYEDVATRIQARLPRVAAPPSRLDAVSVRDVALGRRRPLSDRHRGGRNAGRRSAALGDRHAQPERQRRNRTPPCLPPTRMERRGTRPALLLWVRDTRPSPAPARDGRREHRDYQSAAHTGFKKEGALRQSSWVLGRFSDSVVMAILADEWGRHR